ncbi:MAG: aspartate kinase [Planctomycetota bacterium]
MKTVAQAIEQFVASSPFLEEGLSRGLINCSALAREMQPRLQETLLKDVSESAILMAIKRLSLTIQGRGSIRDAVLRKMGDLTVRSSLSEYTFLKSDTIMEKQKLLLQALDERSDQFVTFTRGVFEITIIVSSSLADSVEAIFNAEKRISRLHDLSAIIIKLPEQTVSTPGVHYTILKQLAWNNINVVEVVSTYTEFTVILHKNQVDFAFSVLMELLSS